LEQLFENIILSLFVAVGVGLFIKFFVKTSNEKIYEKNRSQTIDLIFYHLSFIDSYKKSIYGLLEPFIDFNNESPRKISLDENAYNEIFRYRKLIVDKFAAIPNFRYYSTYLTRKENDMLIGYIASIFFFGQIQNMDKSIRKNEIFFFPRTLKQHRFLAKSILDTFEKDIDINFKEDWKKELMKFGGVDIRFPTAEPGDVPTAADNILGELSAIHYPELTSIHDKLDDIIKKLDKR